MKHIKASVANSCLNVRSTLEPQENKVKSVFLFWYIQDEKLTVTQAAQVNGNPSFLRFHYQLSECRSAIWETVLSKDSLFLEIPSGTLAEGSKEG